MNEERKRPENNQTQLNLLSLFDTYSNIFVFLYPQRFTWGQSGHLEEGGCEKVPCCLRPKGMNYGRLETVNGPFTGQGLHSAR